MRRLIIAALAYLSMATPLFAQSYPSWMIYGAVGTTAQWQSAFSSKQDALGYVPINRAGDTMQGRLTLWPSATSGSGFNVNCGVAPTSPQNGDVWCTTAGIFVQISGATVGPLLGAGGGTTGSGAYVLANSPTLSGTIGGNLAFSGNETFNGTMTAPSLSRVGTVAGSLCSTSGGLFLYITGTNCYGTAGITSIAAGGGTPTTVTNAIAAGNCLYNNNGVLGDKPCGNKQPLGRLTLQASTPVMTTSQTNQTTLRYDCYHGGNLVWVWNGTQDVPLAIGSCEITTAMQTTGTGVLNSTGVFDAWAVNISGTLTLCVATNGTGGGWASDTGGSNTARGSGYSALDSTTRPFITNAVSLTHCYNGVTDEGPVSINRATHLGTIYTNAAGTVSYTLGSAASGGGAALLGVWNQYNRVAVGTTVTDSGIQYTYNSTARQARNSAGNQIQFVYGAAEESVQATYTVENKLVVVAGADSIICIGLDSTSTCTSTRNVFQNPAASVALIGGATNSLTIASPIGIHNVVAVEASDGTNLNTFDSASTNALMARLKM